MNTEQFQWTDETVNEMVHKLCPNYIPRNELNWAQAIDKFKKSKLKPQELKDNEIYNLKANIKSVHILLDEKGIPREKEGHPYSINERITLLERKHLRSASEMETMYLQQRTHENKTPNTEYEILTYSNPKNEPHKHINTCKILGCKIHSVLRKSDGEVFTVGDRIKWGWLYCASSFLTIAGFEILYDHLYATVKESTNKFKLSTLTMLTKQSPIPEETLQPNTNLSKTIALMINVWSQIPSDKSPLEIANDILDYIRGENNKTRVSN